MSEDGDENMVKGGKIAEALDFGVTELRVDVKGGLSRYVKLLMDGPWRVRAIILMGSRARGDWKPHSDTDILVIAESLPEDHSELLATLNPPEAWGLLLEPRAYTHRGFIEGCVGPRFDSPRRPAGGRGPVRRRILEGSQRDLPQGEEGVQAQKDQEWMDRTETPLNRPRGFSEASPEANH